MRRQGLRFRVPSIRPHHSGCALLELVLMRQQTASVAAASMVGSYVIASRVGSRSGALAAMLGPLGWCATAWNRDHGVVTATALTAVYVGGFGASHPLARRVGAWPAVLGAAALTGAATHAVAGRGQPWT